MLNINVSDPKALETAIQSVYKFADNSPHNSMPTQNIMVQTADNGLTLTATDLYTSVELAVNSSDVFSDGGFCVKATTLKKIGEIIKDQSAIFLEQDADGVNLSLFDAPTFGARFEVEPTDEFPMCAETDPNAHWIEFDPEHIATIKALTKYAENKERTRVGYDAVQFASVDDTLYAYTTDGDAIAYTKLGRTLIPNFAIPVDAIKKAFQVAASPELKKAVWRVTLPSEEREVLSIQIADTAVKVRAGDAIDLTDWILKRVGYFGVTDDLITFDPKALKDGLKKVSKLFVKENRVENVLIIEGNAMGNITMTAKAVKGSYNFNKTAVAMPAEYIHNFTQAEAEFVTEAKPIRIQVDARKFEGMVRDLASSKPEKIAVHALYGDSDNENAPNQDAVLVSEPDAKLGFILHPEKL